MCILCFSVMLLISGLVYLGKPSGAFGRECAETLRLNKIHWTRSKTTPPFNLFVHDPKECQYISKSILTSGFWERDITEKFIVIMGDAKQKRRLFLDIGANLGWFSLVVANMGHRVISVEPMKYNVELLLASLCNNSVFDDSLITVYNMAFSTEPEGEACVRPSYAGGPQNEGNGQIGPHSANDSSTCREFIQMRRMDDVLQGLEERPFLIKIDVEGHELRALQGGRNVFSRLRPCIVVFEHIDAYIRFAKGDPTELFGYFVSLNYSVNNRKDSKSIASAIRTDFNYAVNYMDKECVAALPKEYTIIAV